MKTRKGRALEKLHNKVQAKKAAIEAKRAAIDADDNPWGTPIDYRHLSDQQLIDQYENTIASIPVDVSEFEAMDVQGLIQEYTRLLG
jgi:hypothetical protein